jgi:hypothetical protein
MTTLNDWHKENLARQHEAFAPPHSLEALVVCVGEEVGELCAAMLGVTGEKKRKAHLTNADVLDACADAFTYCALVVGAVGTSDLEGLLGLQLSEVPVGDLSPLRRTLQLQALTGKLAEAAIDDMFVARAARSVMWSLVSLAKSRECTDFAKLLGDTFNMVSDRAGSKIRTRLGQQPIAAAG